MQDGDVVAHSDDAGKTWKLLPGPSPGAIHALHHAGGDVLLAAGDAGRIWRSTDAGQTWKLVETSDFLE